MATGWFLILFPCIKQKPRGPYAPGGGSIQNISCSTSLSLFFHYLCKEFKNFGAEGSNKAGQPFFQHF